MNSQTKNDVLYEIENLGVYNTFKFKTDDNDLALYIHTHLDTMSEQELKMIANKCIHENMLKSLVLKYEMKHWNPEKSKMTLSDFTLCAKKLLFRYQSRAGGFLLEDREWIVHSHTSKKYELKKNEIVFENTLSSDYTFDKEVREYIFDIITLLNKLSDNIKVSLHKYIADRDSLCWIILKCKYFDQPKKDNTCTQNNIKETKII